MADCQCLLCGTPSPAVLNISGWNPAGVTSDCRPWNSMGEIVRCVRCGHIQKRRSATWVNDVDAIYDSYSVYASTGGEDQLCFSADGQAEARAKITTSQLCHFLMLPEDGSLLDFGCGVGQFLTHFHTERPNWKLFGQELGRQFQEKVLSLSGVVDFYTDIELIPEQFDLITLNDVLEHLTDPADTLKKLARLLKPHGVIFARSPQFIYNPFDLVIVDHCSHFTTGAVSTLLSRAGLKIQLHGFPFLPKEIGLLAKIDGECNVAPTVDENSGLWAFDCLSWLRKMLSQFVAQATHDNYILGSSIAGVWTAAMLRQDITLAGFVDEDVSRHVGETTLGLSVVGLQNLPDESTVFLPFPHSVAKDIQTRLQKQFPGINFVCPIDE